MNNILLTGSTGFIGRHLVSLLLKQSIKIRVLTRNTSSSLPEGIETFVGDLTNSQSLVGICEKIDTVFHLAGLAHASNKESASFSHQHHVVNFLGTQNLLNETIRSGVKKFIYFSSVKAVADSNDCIDETWDIFPDSPYGIAKRQAEKFVLNAQNNSMHVCVLRPSLVYGIGWKGNLASMLHMISRGLFPPLPETYNRRSMVSAHDICRAAIMAANNPIANGKIYFVTDGIDYSTRQLYISICQALGKSIPKWTIPLSVFKCLATMGDLGEKLLKQRLPFNSAVLAKLFNSAQYSSKLIQGELGFKPTCDLISLLPEIVLDYRKELST